jgi:phosphoenolpyruvate carboxykinase (ATP)
VKKMKEFGIIPSQSDLSGFGITEGKIHWNIAPETLAEISVQQGMAQTTASGAITVDTGEFTGRSPKDRFIVRDALTEDAVWWGDINIGFDPAQFDALALKVGAYLNGKELYARDVYACADDRYRMNIRVVNEYPWSNLFAYNMFLRPSAEELAGFTPEWTILNAPGFKANPAVDGTRQHNFAILNFTRKMIIIGGTGYTGEIKKGIFSALNFILPHQKNTLSMHCSANVGRKGDTAIFFGLSGTGKTTLSADPNRALIGDDEHGWSAENTIFNFEGGCYAKVIDLSAEKEPDIFAAIKPGALLENISFKPGTAEVDYTNGSKTENTRVSYPINHIKNIQTPSIGHNPKNIFFLTADAFGVLPPLSKLTRGQAMYHFISGYTAKVAGTEMGVTEPQPSFSAGFGKAFLPLHPGKYAEMLGRKLEETGVNVWLVNTGWSGGSYGVGSRIKLAYTRALITAVLEGQLDAVPFERDPFFGLHMPTSCPNVPDAILNPRGTWGSAEAYDKAAADLAARFHKNFEQFASGVTGEILAGGPLVAEKV